MSLKLSTGLRNNMLDLQPTIKGYKAGATLSFADNGALVDSITDSGNGLITSGFCPGDRIYTKAATTGGNVFGPVTLLSVAAATMTFVTGTCAASEAFLAAGKVSSYRGGSLADIFHDGIIRIYSGTQPTNADTAFAGTLLLSVTAASGAFVAGAFDNGLEFGAAASGAISKNSEVWSGVAAASGTAGWFRLMANATDASGASTSLPRVDGSIGTSGADLNMSSTTITSGQTYTIDTFTLTLPSYYGA